MRGYVERMEMLEYFMPEGKYVTHDDVMDSYFDDVDNANEEEE